MWVIFLENHPHDTSFSEKRARDNKKKLTIAIDEVQQIPSILNTVQSLIDDNKQYKFYLTGSSARKLRRGQANLLPGRILPFSLFPINYWELKNSQTDFELKQILIGGCLPEVLLDKKEGLSILEAYSTIYLREEIQGEALTKNLGSYARFLDLAAETSGQFINYAKLASDSEISKETIRRYFQILEDTLIIHRIESFTALSNKRKARQTDRYIFFDIGVRNALLNKTRSEFTATELGPLFEQWVILQIISYNHYFKKNWKILSYRDDRNLEIDLIIDTGMEIHAVEIKYQKKFRDDFVSNINEFAELYKGKKILKKHIVYIGEVTQKTKSSVTISPYDHFFSEIIPNIKN